MPTKDELRSILRNNLEATVLRLNSALRAKKLEALRPVLARIGRGKQLPHWFEQLAADATLPNLDGKTVGSVIEMLLVAVLETSTFAGIANMPELRINPARRRPSRPRNRREIAIGEFLHKRAVLFGV